MKRQSVAIMMSIAIVLGVYGVLPVSKVQAAAAITTYNYVPTFIPDDQTPVAVHVTFSNLTIGECYIYKVRLYRTAGSYFGETWNATSSSWVTSGGIYSSQNQFNATATSQSFWVYVRNTNLAASTAVNDANLAIVASSNTGSATCNTGPTFSNGTPVAVTIMKQTSGGTPTQFGGWLEESNGTSRAGRAVVVKNGSTIVGMYAVENNNITEGYSSTPGYFRVAAPTCTACTYTIETWDLVSPGTAVGTINTLGSNGCPNSITAAAVTSLNSCTTPTSITLISIAANPAQPSSATLIFAGLIAVAVSAIVLIRRRSRAA